MIRRSQRYQKNLVTVAMGFRTEEDISKNGCHIYTKKEKTKLIEYVSELFNKKGKVLTLKVKMTGYHSQHIEINNQKDLDNFINNIDDIFEKDNEIWVIDSQSSECIRCRLYLSDNGLEDLIEVAYTHDDHIFDHITMPSKTPYICYKIDENRLNVIKSYIKDDLKKEIELIVKDILNKYAQNFTKIRQDLHILNIHGISLDILVNNGYDFHDFDITNGDLKEVINYYLLKKGTN